MSTVRTEKRERYAVFPRRHCVRVSLMLALAVCHSRADTSTPALAAYRPQVSNAVERGVEALARRQGPDGAFTRDGWGDHTAIVGLAGLAFLGAGYTPSHPRYGSNVSHAVDFILAHQQPDGLLFHGDSVHGWAYMYSHAIGTIFLTQCSGMLDVERQARVDNVLARAVALLLSAQTRPKSPDNQGGWRYTPASNDSDLSHTAWCLMALRAARINGAQVPRQNVDLAVAYVRGQFAGTGFRYSSHYRKQPTVCMSAVAVLALSLAGFHNDPTLAKAGHRILPAVDANGRIAWEGGPSFPGREEYTLYHVTGAMYQLGGSFWEQYAPRMYARVLGSQGPDGSWGGIYTTAIHLLCLEVTYRQLPIHQR